MIAYSFRLKFTAFSTEGRAAAIQVAIESGCQKQSVTKKYQE